MPQPSATSDSKPPAGAGRRPRKPPKKRDAPLFVEGPMPSACASAAPVPPRATRILPPASPPPGDLFQRLVTIERIYFQSGDGAFAAFRARCPDNSFVRCAGPCLPIRVDEQVNVVGNWEEHPRFGRQVAIVSVEPRMPVTTEGVSEFLAMVCEGVGPTLGRKIVDFFGASDLPSVLDDMPERLTMVPGIGKATVRKILAGWREHREKYAIFPTLLGFGISPVFAARIVTAWGAGASGKVRENPYALTQIFGMGFVRADAIASNMEITPDDPRRATAAVLHVLDQAAGNGHVFLSSNEITEETTKLSVPAERVAEALTDLKKQDLIEEDERYFLVPLYQAEQTVSEHLVRLAKGKTKPVVVDWQTQIALLERDLQKTFAPEQIEAIRTAARSPVMVLTGGPGTGKTTITRSIVQLARDNDLKVVQCAPTGRAAKQLSESTGYPATTIHRLLGYTGNGFMKNARFPIEADLVIVDETSMLDVLLAKHLLDAIPTGARLLLIGDADQLSSVGPGDVLRDVIRSQRIPTVRLRQIFRQSERSGIVVASHAVLAGERLRGGGGFWLSWIDAAEETTATVLDLVTRESPLHGLDPRQVQVLAPMYRGEGGIDALNAALGTALNPGVIASIEHRGQTYRVGDKVLQTKNRTEDGVFNGDIGFVSAVDPRDRCLAVDFGGLVVEYAGEALDTLRPGWCVSIHKAQGSEFPAVVIVMLTNHYLMLRRQILYTAITRARQRCYLVTTPKALGIAMRSAELEKRNTMLAMRIASIVASP